MAAKRSSSATSSSHKRKKAAGSGAGSAASPVDYSQFYGHALSLLLELPDESTGEKIALPFVKLPPKKVYPDYYEIIENPIAISDIQRKAKLGKYPDSSADEFLEDFRLLVENAAKYNDPESWIVDSANRVLEFIESEVQSFSTKKNEPPLKIRIKIPEEEPEAETDDELSPISISHLFLDVLDELISYDFPDEGIISLPFMENVDTVEYPDYLNYVKSPTSFNEVISQINNNTIVSSKLSTSEALQKLHDSTLLIFTNAYLYNDPSTEIYQDAAKLQAIFTQKFKKFSSEIEAKSLSKPKIKLSLKLKDKRKKVKSENDQDAEQLKLEDYPEDTTLNSVVDAPDESPADPTKGSLTTQAEESRKPVDKNLPLLPENDCIIQETSVSSSVSIVSHVAQYTKQKQEESGNVQLSEPQQIKRSLFPTHEHNQPVTSLFEYKVPANGYTSQSLTVVLPPDVSPFITVKVSLHNLIYGLKSGEMVDGEGFFNLASDDEIQCKLLVNEEEVSNTGSCYEDKRQLKSGEEELLAISYDLKLSHGLNIVDFECKVAPSLSKKIKKESAVAESEEIAGRHTRHQLQQMKMTWDVERITYYIVCNTI